MKNLFHYYVWSLSQGQHYVRSVPRLVRQTLKDLHHIQIPRQSLQLVHAAKAQLKCDRTGRIKAGLLAVLHIQVADGPKITAKKKSSERPTNIKRHRINYEILYFPTIHHTSTKGPRSEARGTWFGGPWVCGLMSLIY